MMNTEVECRHIQKDPAVEKIPAWDKFGVFQLMEAVNSDGETHIGMVIPNSGPRDKYVFLILCGSGWAGLGWNNLEAYDPKKAKLLNGKVIVEIHDE